ncbi:endonuclease/exonuclease/phosphatase family protein [Pseudomonas sp. LP_7_YM]|uniref:endonuclease/exonuclease/phosphatase family protein n=1 Tax=Pseudomonas sp. LP_7_YM TaxID=2485137 RepID=UPI001060FC2D|nr:endonuclease/exonuclease/phosphatase family protein [Pseudomonas sp. LP_7_YM]TDV61879.1 endonuclease/exonuclease/phosphatase family metal-dependent hydrolase [Pseudomonas sp. LP_7_YM]
MQRSMRYIVAFALLIALAAGLLYDVTWHPAKHEKSPVTCNAKDAPPPLLASGQALKVMTWNIQHLAGKRYVFWYDMADGSGPDERPTPEDIAYNLDEVARVIRDEQPDIVLLQDVDDGAKNTDYTDQLALLQERVTDLYPCSTEAFYWKADFVPNPHIYGSVGTKLAMLSRYRVDRAERLRLPSPKGNLLSRQFEPKRALLVSYLPLRNGGQLAVVNTHLGDLRLGDDTLQRQVSATIQLMESFERSGTLWISGGDFNLLPKGQYERLPVEQRAPYAPHSELGALWEKYPMIPSNDDVNDEDRGKWYTRFPNDPRVSGPDRTLDYLFYSPALQRVDAQVRRTDTLLISDHLPVIGRFLLPLGR